MPRASACLCVLQSVQTPVLHFLVSTVCLDILCENVNLLANTSDLNTPILQKCLLYYSSITPTPCSLNISVEIGHMFNYFTFSHSEEATYELSPADRLAAPACFSSPCLSTPRTSESVRPASLFPLGSLTSALLNLSLRSPWSCPVDQLTGRWDPKGSLRQPGPDHLAGPGSEAALAWCPGSPPAAEPSWHRAFPHPYLSAAFPPCLPFWPLCVGVRTWLGRVLLLLSPRPSPPPRGASREA